MVASWQRSVGFLAELIAQQERHFLCFCAWLGIKPAIREQHEIAGVFRVVALSLEADELFLRETKYCPQDSHQIAMELHEQAAHVHRTAAAHHGKQDPLAGHEHFEQAMERAGKAFTCSQEAHQKSEKANSKQ